MNDALQAQSGNPAAVAAAAKQSERKRLKHREYVKKSYKKKLTTLENLRRELNALDHQYASMLLQETGTWQYQQIKGGNARATTSFQRPTMQKYLQATGLKKWYREENDRLYQLNACHMKVESRMGQLFDAYEATKVPLHCVPAPYQYHISPLCAAAYEGLIDKAKIDVLCFARNPVKVSTGAQILGWTDKREVHERKFEFALQKEIGVSPLVLLQRSWSIFSDPVEFSKIYGSALDVQFHVLQHVDENTILIYRRIAPAADDSRVVKSIFLLAKRAIREGFMLLFRSVDKDLVHFREVDVNGQPQDYMDSTSALKLMRSEMWVDKDVWVLIHNVPKEPEKCLFQFGGATTTTLWLREVLFIAVRWENMAVGSQFSLTAD
uniref:BZIP domain-containing protein n=1 Tax=Peronospora matthiolae TaxID=2874970 RepID=A0AAV1TPN3_9STRA